MLTIISKVFFVLIVFGYTSTWCQNENDDSFVSSWFEWLRKPGEQADQANHNYWHAHETILKKVKQTLNKNVAKNIILFVGDGMSLATLKAARIYLSQLEGVEDESIPLSFENFPYVGLSKTSCLNTQVPDSACTATQYLCGVKARHGTIGLTGRVKFGDCLASTHKSNRPDSIARWSQLAGKRTGIVTTTRVTHATPAGTYAHSARRDWESDTDGVPPECKDVAYQLVHGETGKNLNVVLGGGRREFLPNYVFDEEGYNGRRSDGLNLLDDWLKTKKNHQYVWNRSALLNVSVETEYLLGLFESGHCQYHLDANEENEPSLQEMTEVAIKLLSRVDEGYFLFVEGGRIDTAHHETKAHKALDETIEFSKAIQRARDITSEDDTLIVVTSDHAHVMTVSGYPKKGTNIFGIAGKGIDGIPYSTLSYANGQGHKPEVNGRYNISQDNLTSKDYEFPALVPLISETHGGDDVAIYASGPWAHLFTGVMHQHVIPHTMAFAACVGNGPTTCQRFVD